MDTEQVLQLPEELLYIWHAHRTGILLTAGVLVACVRLAIHWRRSRRKVALTPPLGSPVDEKKVVPFENRASSDDIPGDVRPRTLPPRTAKAGPKRVTGVKRSKSGNANGEESKVERLQPYIFYYSLGGSTKAHAERLLQSPSLQGEHISTPFLHDLTEIDHDDFFTSPAKSSDGSGTRFYLFLFPSYDISTELDTFIESLKETHHDFRIDTAPLRSLAGYAVLGFGDGEGWPSENEGFCKDGAEVDRWMAKLTAGKRAWPVGMVDVKGEKDLHARMDAWIRGVRGILDGILSGEGLGEGAPGSGEAVESGDEEDVEEEETDVLLAPSSKRKPVKRSRTADLEDMKGPIPVDFTTSSSSNQPKAMVPTTSPTYTSLTKQGYTIIGTHSGVKTCRWTKSALRGRGSCYKYSFYGIASHRCMEATPSLSCSNKCVFCWRHGTNPTGTTWRWQVDPPDEVFQGMIGAHLKKIKMLRGVPGVRAERFQEGLEVRHCALSLVGEPIFYPHINRLLDLLHGEHISTFLVCNAQHPDQLAALNKVTQLYVSIDASNKDSLKKIDRPLHRDFWQRFIRCMDILRARRFEQRTVFRLTLVKGFNIEEEAEGYADLVERALPGFVEVKGVTYCGTSTAAGAGLSMKNVPFYEEVSAFVLALEAALQRRGLDYGVAAEHAHSCCILLADRSRFHLPVKDGGDGEKRWHTLISYPKFFECLEKGEAFGPEDYIGEPTPEWALWGNGGFDPRDERVDRKGGPKGAVGGEGKGRVEEVEGQVV